MRLHVDVRFEIETHLPDEGGGFIGHSNGEPCRPAGVTSRLELSAVETVRLGKLCGISRAAVVEEDGTEGKVLHSADPGPAKTDSFGEFMRALVDLEGKRREAAG